MTKNLLVIILFQAVFILVGSSVHESSCDKIQSIVAWICSSGINSDINFLKELFPFPRFTHLSFKELVENANMTLEVMESVKVLVYNVENSNEDGKYMAVVNAINRFTSIDILVHLSDEFKANSKKWKYGEGIEMYHQRPKLVLRQYGIFPYGGSLAENISKVMQIPLGFAFNYSSKLSTYEGLDADKMSHLQDSVNLTKFYSSHRLSAGRNINWSFVGGLSGRKGRKQAVDFFTQWSNYSVEFSMPAQEMLHTYAHSKFVLAPRGQVNLESFRFYEAIIAGAIPIVIGPKWEVDAEFYFENYIPPLLHAESLELALTMAQNMSNTEVDLRRIELAQWYTHCINNIKQRIRNTLFNNTFQRDYPY